MKIIKMRFQNKMEDELLYIEKLK